MVNWWALSVDEVFKHLGSSENGLRDEEAEERLKKVGRNTIESKRVKPLSIFAHQFTDPIILILIVSAVILQIIGHTLETAVVALIVFVSAFLGFVQEWKAEKTIESLRGLMVQKVRVKRDGRVKIVDSSELVPGDVVIVEAGMKVPADARIIRCKELFVDESVLTGESEAVEKSSEVVDAEAILPERRNMLYAGTIVLSGHGEAVVVETGNRTEMGRISELTQEEEKIVTPLLEKIKHMGRQLSTAIVAVSAFNFLVGYLRGYDILYTAVASLSLAVAAIPEALPALITVSLAMGVKVMADRNVLIRKLPAVETLGGVTVICTDKTGTLTQNRMKVSRIRTRSGHYSAEELKGETNLDEDLRLILTASYVCNKATYEIKDGEIVFHGDPTETALLELAIKMGITPNYRLMDEIPFDSKRKFMAVASEINGRRFIFVKGAPEVVERMARAEEGIADICAAMGIRVIAFAYKEIDELDDLSESLRDLNFLGHVCLMDPLREDSPTSVQECKKAGIRVVMITGDHSNTAKTIASAVGIEGEVVSGRELEKMDFKEAVRNYSVFARVTPEQKLEIVKAFQELGEVVAVTGDGVNDAPALKRADIGVAMGEGSDVAREAADMVLLDNAFSSIVKAVEVGRDVFRKIQRIFSWILPTNGGQAGIVLTAFLLGLPLPMMPLHILWVNTVTAALLGTMLVFDRMEEGLLNLKPTKGELLNRVIMVRVAYISIISVLLAYFFYFHTGKMSAAMNSVIAVAMWYLLTPHVDKSFFRVRKNPYAILGFLLTLLLQIAVTNFGGVWLMLEPMSVEEWATVVLLTSSVFWVVEIEKHVYRFIARG